MVKPKGFPKQARLTKRGEFLRIRNGAASHVGTLAIIDRKPSPLGRCRLGITVSRKFGKSVIRNRFKRAVREAFRHFDWRGASFDIHIRPRAKAHDAEGSLIRNEIATALERIFHES